MENGILKIIGRLFNISETEWKRALLSWGLAFFYKTSLILGWTILISSFLSRLGITGLPYLFALNAIFTIIGCVVFSKLIQITDKNNILMIASLFAGVFLYLAIFFSNYNDFFFFFALLIGESLLISQLGILISIFNEELFTPLESERIFPIIESAETLGVLFAGIIINRLALVISTSHLIYIWILLVLMTIPLITIYLIYFKKLPILELKRKKDKSHLFQNIGKTYQYIKKTPFLKALLSIVILLWMFTNLFEFQYTKSIQQAIINKPERMILMNDAKFINVSIPKIEKKKEKNTETPIKMAKKMTTYEQDLTYDLGSLHIIFSTIGLLFQLIIASRLINNLGLINSMMLNPIVMIFAIIGLTLRYNFFTGIISKASLEVSNVFFKNPYHSSFYSLSEDFRKQAKELFEGIAKPVGALLGTAILILFQNIYINENLTLAINLTLLALTIILLSKLYYSRETYTKLATDQLNNAENMHSKLESLEILSQKGHKESANLISRIMTNESEEKDVKIKALELLGEIKDQNQIPEIINCLSDNNQEVRLATLECLEKYEKLNIYTNTNAFSLYRIITTLKDLFNKEKEDENRCLIIKILAQFNNTETVEFILKNLKNSSNIKIKKSCINACMEFQDSNCAYYLMPYLKSQNKKLKVAVLSTLWNFPKYRQQIKKDIEKIINDKNQKNLALKIELIGNLQLIKEKKQLKEVIKSKNINLKVEAEVALAKMGNTIALNYLSKWLLLEDEIIIKKILKATKSFDPKLAKKFKIILQQELSDYINNILNKNKKNHLEDIPLEDLYKLKKAYKLAEEHEGYYEVSNLINNNLKINFPKP